MINNRITGTQLSIIVFMTSLSFLSSFTVSLAGGNLFDSVAAVFISWITGGLLALPIFILKDKGVLERDKIKTQTSALWVVYILFFIYSLSWDVSALINMLGNTIFPEMPAWVIIIVLISLCIYGAKNGVEVLGRTSGVVFVLFLIGLLVLIFSAMPKFNTQNSKVLFYDGPKASLTGAMGIFVRSTVVPQIFFLVGFVKGTVKVKYYVWSFCAALSCGIMLFLCAMCLGGYADTQQFPVYTLAAVSELVPLQRLDVVFSVVWLLSMSVRLMLGLLCIKECLNKISGNGTEKNSQMLPLTIIGAGVMALSIALVTNPDLRISFLSVPVYFISAIVLGGVVPLVILAVTKITENYHNN